jgi:hypothetical protein
MATRDHGREGRRAWLPWRTYVAVLALLVLLRAALPHLLLAYVDWVLDGTERFEADIGDLDLNLWRGAYEVENLVLHKESRDPEVAPFLECARLDLAVSWAALVRGDLVTDTVLHRPILRIRVGDRGEHGSQTGEDASWRDRLQALTPLGIDRFAVRDGEVHYAHRFREDGDEVDFYIDDLYLEAIHLTDAGDAKTGRKAEIEVAGRPFGTGELEGVARFDPLADPLDLELRAQAIRIHLPDLNDWILARFSADAEEGELALYSEVVLAGDRVEGYLKVFVEHPKVFDMEEIDDLGDMGELLWEGAVSLTAELLEHPTRDRIATRVPLSGDLSDVDTERWVMVVELLQNAFIEGLRPALDHSSRLGRRANEGS